MRNVKSNSTTCRMLTTYPWKTPERSATIALGARRGLRALASAAALTACTGLAMGDIFFSDFSAVDGLNMLGDATTRGTGNQAALAITSGPSQVSSIWCMDRQNIVDAWSTKFLLSITDVTRGGADGFAFVVQASSVDMHEDTSAGRGGGLGYNGGTNLLAIEFDTWMNLAADDRSDNHISIQNAGSGVTTSHHDDSLGIATDILDLSSGEFIGVQISYEPGTMRIALNDVLVLEAPVDMRAALDSDGTAWVGFTGAGTSIWQTVQIHAWAFDDIIPEPASVTLLGLGLLGLGRRRRSLPT